MLTQLGESWRYERALERLSRRASRRARPVFVVDGGPAIQNLRPHLAGLAQQLARQVAAGRYRFSPAVPHRVVVDKPRTLYAMTAADHAVLLVLADVLSRAIEPRLPEALHSYRRGRSPRTAIDAFAAYLRSHRHGRDKREWGLYVLRRDVRAYGDSIAAGPDSPLWGQLREALSPLDALSFEWLQHAFCPPVQWPDGSVTPREVGILNGNPCQTVACNLYCSPVDRALSAVGGGLYLRYGDDVLFAHPDVSQAREAERSLDRLASQLRLEWGADKSKRLYFTGPGRPPAAGAEDFAPCRSVDFVGTTLSFDGRRSLPAAKQRLLLHRLGSRLGHALRGGHGPAELEQRARVAVGVVARALEPRSVVRDPLVDGLLRRVDDRRQLRHLDHEIALLVAQRVVGRRGVRSFRLLPPRKLYDLGLPSLVQRRNRLEHDGG